MQPKLNYKCGETYEPLERHLKQPTDGIKNTHQKTNVHKNTYNKIQEKVLSLSIVLFQVEPISRLSQLIPIEIYQFICTLI